MGVIYPEDLEALENLKSSLVKLLISIIILIYLEVLVFPVLVN